MSWGTIKDNLQKENSNDKSHQARGISVHTDQHQSKELWSCLGEPQIPPQHHILLHRSCHWKKRDREVREPHNTSNPISLIYKSCLLYYNKWFIAHASFLKGEAYFRLRISRIFAMFVKSKSNCPVKNKTKTKTKFTISWIIHPIWLDLTFNLSEDRGIDYITMNNILLPYNIKQLDSLLQSV